MPTLFNFPPSTFLTNLFSSLLLHPDSLPLLLHSNSLQTVTASMLVLESTGSSLPSSSHHHTFLPSTTSPNCLSAVSPSSIPHSLPLPFTSFRDQVSGTLLEPQLLPTQTQVDYPFQPSTFFFPSTPIPPRFDKTENLALFPSPSLESPLQSPSQQPARFAACQIWEHGERHG